MNGASFSLLRGSGQRFWARRHPGHGGVWGVDMRALAKAVPSGLGDELVTQAVASIEAADHFSLPFPHIVFRNFFPADFYRNLVRSIPADGYDPITGTGTRMALRLYGENVKKIARELRDAWAAVSVMLTSEELERAIRVKLHDGLEIRARGDKVGGP